MARYSLACAIVVGAVRYPAGTTVADTQGNALPGDVVLTQVTTTQNGQGKPDATQLIPLDSTAAAVLGLPIGTNLGVNRYGAGQM
jgi:predicted dinucleotide-binding enzyme